MTGVVRGLRLLPFAALVLVALAFVACGGDDDKGNTPAATTTSTAATSTKAAASPTQKGDQFAAYRALDYPQDLADGQKLGKPEAKVTLGVFEDFQCPHCLNFTVGGTEQLIVDEYVKTGKIVLEFHNLPILGQESANAAIGAHCAAEQNRFWPYHKALFLAEADAGQLDKEQIDVGRFSPDNLEKFAADVGMDTAAFHTCLFSDEAATAVTDEIRLASQLGVRSTPTFTLNGQVIATPVNPTAWRATLDKAVSEAK